ncbi:MAG: PKD domain-containing protein [Candidatus Omnitrophica bacterium]|nr:PKD domain-containing protein [Candidatus Omnitrophota bacterium]
MQQKAVGWFSVVVLAVVLLTGILCSNVFSYTIPQDRTRAEYLYVFGPRGNTYYGADDIDHEQVVFINVPENAPGEVIIKVNDPDTGGFRDLKPTPEKSWDTVVEFAVYGDKATPLASQTFGESPEYDRQDYTFGPFNKEDGKKIGNVFQFKLVAKALEGEDQNLFKLRIYPSNAEAFSDKISFRLLPNEGDKMYFYVGIPAGVSNIVVENYDLDPDGGVGSLEDPLTGRAYKIADSASAQWSSTPIELVSSNQDRRAVYVITKKTQRYANAAVRVKDDKGNILPLYYALGRPIRAERPRVAPPVKVSPDLKCNKFTFDATSSYDPNREKITYLWDFGDGTTSTEPVVTHLYERGGEFTVTLTVQDNSTLECDTSISTQKVKVNTPPQVNFASPDSACVGNVITFDASSTTDDTPDTLIYTWDFGDGTKGKGRTINKTYEKGGTYKVLLGVDDGAGTPCSTGSMVKTINVNSAPIADAGSDIDMCFATNQELRVSFNGGRSSDPDRDALTYTWNFGDGETASGESVSHVFSKPGDYTVGLTVSDGRDSSCSMSSDSVAVRLNRKPIADAGDDIVACAGGTVTLDGSGSQGDNLKYSWNFGDGETAEGARVTHNYATGGRYKATLTVDDGKGTRCSLSSSAVNVLVNGTPVVTLDNEESVCVGTAVRFNAAARDPEGDALLYAWDFGDGTVANGGASQSHAYAKGGVYTVQVTVDDKQGTPCSLASATTRVKVNGRPIADAGENLVCCVDKETRFDGSGSTDPDGDALSYNWSFGDGATAQGARVTHAYSKSGTYTVTLRVDDNSGTPCSSSTSSFEARVNESPVSIIKVR